MAIGLEPGKPIEWLEDGFNPPVGPVVKVDISWMDGETQITRTAQELFFNAKTGEPMAEDWVFTGSQTFKDEESGKTIYLADSGDLVCVSNFSSAMLDVPFRSDGANASLLFKANPEKIPVEDTLVLLYFKAGEKTAEGDEHTDEAAKPTADKESGDGDETGDVE
ncbi:MAG: YdjY domain-containing protein [Pirellulaceae bacterium]